MISPSICVLLLRQTAIARRLAGTACVRGFTCTTTGRGCASFLVHSCWLLCGIDAPTAVVQSYASSLQVQLVKLSQRVGLQATRWELVDEQRQPLSSVAALIHQLVPGVRLM